MAKPFVKITSAIVLCLPNGRQKKMSEDTHVPYDLINK